MRRRSEGGAGERDQRAEPMPPAEIERRRRSAMAEQEQDPGHATADEVGANHAPDAPALEVSPLHERIELDPGARSREPHTEVDVLHELDALVEPTHGLERVPADGAETRPERRRWAGGVLVDMMMEKVPEAGHHAGGGGRVVVRAEERGQAGIGLEA